MTVRVGDILICNDPRLTEKRVMVLRITERDHLGDEFAVYNNGIRECYIRLDRIFDDGKVRTKGWRIVRPEAPPVQVAGSDALLDRVPSMAIDGGCEN
jgi:hypothetical protein